MNPRSIRSVHRTAAIVALLGLGLLAGTSSATTPDSTCAAGHLDLVSPASVDLRFQSQGRQGMSISWPDLDLFESTCFTLSDTQGLDFNVAVDGGFGDQVDRVFQFTSTDSGSIATPQSRNIVVTWQNIGAGTYGNLSGKMNIANNGGIWQYAPGSDSWTQVNDGLPMTWLNTNVVALDRGTGSFMVAAFTRGSSFEAQPTGLYTLDGTSWTRIAPGLFTESVRVTAISISPGDNNSFAVGTATRGLYVTNDGGTTFSEWNIALDPAYSPTPTNYQVRGLLWTSARLLVSLPNYGVFKSVDGGATFVRSYFKVPANLDEIDPANPDSNQATATSFAEDPTNPDRVVAGLQFHGAYETTDGGTSWHDLNGNLVVRDSTVSGAWVNNGVAVTLDAVDPQTVILAVGQKGLYRSSLDGGNNLIWTLVGTPVQPGNPSQLQNFSFAQPSGQPGTIWVFEDGWGLLRSQDSGLTWEYYVNQPVLVKGRKLHGSMDGSGQLTLASYGGGIYLAGTPLAMSETYDSGTTSSLRSLDLGLSVTYFPGYFNQYDTFNLVCQTFQGWAVWRASSTDRYDPILVGLYDRVNPETCLVGYCGDFSVEPVPNCYAAKRAACFNFDTPDTIRFFDEEVYNGFSYYYSVTSYDYGNTALDSPQNNTNPMVISPRYKDDPNSPYTGTGNQTWFQIDKPTATATSGEEIYAFPNPVRAGAGIPRGEGSLVTITNLPPSSRVRIFTTAGDDVINLGPDNQEGGQMYWRTVNRDGEEVAPGVYLYLVEMPEREDYWGRIVVIR